MSESTARGARAVLALLLCLLAAALAARAAYYCWGTWATLVRWPFERVGGEATMLHESRLLEAHGRAAIRLLYGPQAADRFVAGNYPPLYLLLWAAKPGPAAYPTGRALALLAGLLAAGAGGVAAYAAAPGPRHVRAATGLLGGAAFLCTVPAFQQLGIAKPDMLALGCAAAGLALFEVAPGRRGTILAGVAFAAGLLAKQSVGFALLAAALAAARRGPRALGALTLAVAAAVLLALVVLRLAGASALADHLVRYNLRDWGWERAADLNARFLTLHWPLLAPALGYAAWAVRARARSALSYYPLVALAALLAVGAEGSSRGYYLELCLAAGLGAALALAALLAARPPAALAGAAATLALVALFAVRAYTVLVAGAYAFVLPADGGEHQTRVLAAVDSAPDPILAYDIGNLALRGRPVAIDDNFLAPLVRRRGLWDDRGIAAAVAARRYSLVLVPRDADEAQLRRLWGDTVADALLAHYRRTGPFTFAPATP